MSTIKPISELRNYNTVLDCVKESEPVYLTKNGQGCYVLIDSTEYERLRRREAEDRLYIELEKSRMSGEIEGWIDQETMNKEYEAILNELRNKKLKAI